MKTIEELQEERTRLFEQQEIINKDLSENFDILQKLKTEREQTELKTPEWYLECIGGHETNYRYEEAKKKFKSFDLSSNGYNPTSDQRVILISAYEHTNKEKQLEGLKYFIPALKKANYSGLYNLDEEHWKYAISIMAPDLNRYSNYVLVSEDKLVWTILDTYDFNTTVAIQGDIEYCLDYIHENLNMSKDYGDDEGDWDDSND